MSQALDVYCLSQESNASWQKLLEEENPQATENMSWNAYLSPILAFKLITVLSGTASLEGKIPWLAMSKEVANRLIKLVSIHRLSLALVFNHFQAKVITDKDGWPGIFEEAIGALWNSPLNIAPGPIVVEQSPSQTVSQKVAASVVQNLNHLTLVFQSKFVGNIIQNIQLAASYLSIMTLVWPPFFSFLVNL